MKKLLTITLILLTATILFPKSTPQSCTGKVVGVADADTITVLLIFVSKQGRCGFSNNFEVS